MSDQQRDDADDLVDWDEPKEAPKPAFAAEAAADYHRGRNGAPSSVPLPPGPAKPVPPAWPEIDNAAYHGLAGEVVFAVEPHTEADPVALLLQYLAAFGNAIGRIPFYQVEGDRHHTNLFVCLVGETSKARKGTSLGRVKQIMQVADPEWAKPGNRIKSGLSSGEGVIWAVHDRIEKWEGGELKTIDPGVEDKRLLMAESEFAAALSVMRREGNILSRIVRDGWDRGDLETLTKSSPAKATGALMSIIGHITDDELRARLDETSMANGYANRFLFAKVRRARSLPHGGDLGLQTIKELGEKTGAALVNARRIQRVLMTPAARTKWEHVYGPLSEGQPGLIGAIIGRAEAQAIRLALLYALLDGRDHIDVVHLEAALAVWEFCSTSARQIFGDSLGSPVADAILKALKAAASAGMSRTDISNLFGHNQSAGQIQFALDLLSERGKAVRNRVPTGGRPIEMWFAVSASAKTKPNGLREDGRVNPPGITGGGYA